MGKFGKKDFQKSNTWRKQCKDILEEFQCGHKVKVTNPNDYFNFVEDPPTYKSQREVMEFDLNNVRNSDLIIANFNDKYSLGTMSEIAISYERKIPIIGLNLDQQELHPWQIEMTNRIFTNTNEMLDYVKSIYLM